ncbi:MAG: anti-sigma factor [Candidatus Aminicenantaceae bacterium]
MRCKKSKERIIFHLYGELAESEKLELENHIKECSECSRDLEFTKKVFNVVDLSREEHVPEGNWESCWQQISARTEGKPEKKKSFIFTYKTVFAAAAMLFVFIMGVVIGKFWLPSLQKQPLMPEASVVSLDQSLKAHFEDLKPVLTEYANYSLSEGQEDTMTIERDVVETLLIQNYLLKRAMAQSNNPSMEQLLEDVDLILREISNLRQEDRPTLSLIKDTINQREILFKIEILKKL